MKPDTNAMANFSGKQPTLSERVAAELVQLIVNGDYHPGMTLPTEPVLEKQFGVSRITIRDAIKLLSSRGLIRVRHGSGMTVQPEESWQYLDPIVLFAHVNSPRSQKMLGEVLEVQRLVESELAALAATRRSDASLARMVALVSQMKTWLDDHPRYTELDVEFHEVIAQAAGNDLLRNMLAPISEVVRDGYMLTVELPGAPGESWKGHKKLLRAIELQDARAAREAMQEHLDLFREHIDKRLNLDAGGASRKSTRTAEPV